MKVDGVAVYCVAVLEYMSRVDRHWRMLTTGKYSAVCIARSQEDSEENYFAIGSDCEFAECGAYASYGTKNATDDTAFIRHSHHTLALADMNSNSNCARRAALRIRVTHEWSTRTRA